MSPPDLAAPQDELVLVTQAIARLQQEHLTETGRPVFHLGSCRRPDLHERVAVLHARAKTLERRISGKVRRWA